MDKKRYVEQEYILKEKYNKKRDSFKRKDLNNNNSNNSKDNTSENGNYVFKKERSNKKNNNNTYVLVAIIAMLIIVFVSYIIIMKNYDKKRLKNVHEKEIEEVKVEKVLSAKRTINSENYYLERELILAEENLANLNYSISKKEKLVEGIPKEKEIFSKIELKIEEEQKKKEEILEKIKVNQKAKQNKKSSGKSIGNDIDKHIEEEYILYLDSENNVVYANYIFKANEQLIFDEKKKELEKDSSFIDIRLVSNESNGDYENNEDKFKIELHSYVEGFEKIDVLDAMKKIDKNTRIKKFTYKYGDANKKREK